MTKKKAPKEDTHFDVKKGLNYYLPSLVKMIEGEFSWRKLNRLWKNQFDKNVVKHEVVGNFQYRLNIFQITVYASKGDPNSVYFANLLNQLFTDLAKMLTTEEKKLLKESLYNLFRYSEDFLNYLGEFMILNALLKTGNYKLAQVEYEHIKGGAKIDFKLKNIHSNQFEYFEVINIEVNDEHVTSHEITERFLRGKLEPKLEAKDKSGIVYALNPVVWIENNDNAFKLKKFYEETGFQIPRVSIPFTHSRFTIGTMNYDKFGSILKAYEME